MDAGGFLNASVVWLPDHFLNGSLYIRSRTSVQPLLYRAFCDGDGNGSGELGETRDGRDDGSPLFLRRKECAE